MPSVTLNDLDQRVLSKLDNNTRLYGTARRYAVINEAVKTIGLFTGLFEASITFTSIKNRIWYDVPYSLVMPTRVQFEDTYLEKTSLLQLGRSHNKWVTANSLTEMCPPNQWLPYGFRKFAIYPADAFGGANITVTGAAEPPVLTVPTDTLSIDNDFFSAFDEYAITALTMKESPKTFAQASTNYQEFIKVMKDIGIFRSWIAPRYYIAEAQQPMKRG